MKTKSAAPLKTTGPSSRSYLPAVRHMALSAFTTLAYSSVLFFVYRDLIAPVYGYQGLRFHQPDPLNYTVAVFVTFTTVLLLPHAIRRASDFILWIFFIIAGAPSILLPHYMGLLEPADQLQLSLVVAGSFAFVRLALVLLPRASLVAPARPELIFGVLYAAWFGVYGTVLTTNSFNLRWSAVTAVYDVRADFAEIASTSPLIGYLLPLATNVINPIMIARGVYSARWSILLTGVGGQVIAYMLTGQKTVLFSGLAIVALAALFRSRPRIRGNSLLLVATLLACGAVLVDKLISSSILTGLFIRRFLVVPGALTVAYVWVFTDQPKTLFAPSPAFWLDSPYDSPSHLVGQLFVGGDSVNANVSLLGHGFLSMGYLGIFIECCVLVGILWMANATSKGLPVAITGLIFFMPTVALASGSVFTTLLTHGFAAAVATVAFLPRNHWAYKAHHVGASHSQKATVQKTERTAKSSGGNP